MAKFYILCRINEMGFICHLDFNNLRNHVLFKHLLTILNFTRSMSTTRADWLSEFTNYSDLEKVT